MSTKKVDYDSGLFKKQVAQISSEVLAELGDAGKKFDSIVDQLAQVWTTERGKVRVSDLRSTKANEFDTLIATVANDEQRFAEVSKDLFSIDQT